MRVGFNGRYQVGLVQVLQYYMPMGSQGGGRARFRVVGWRGGFDVVMGGRLYPYSLIIGRERAQYHTATMTRGRQYLRSFGGGGLLLR